MYKLTAKEAQKLASEIRKTGNRDKGYKKIDDFAKEKGVFDKSKESCFVLSFPDSKIFNAIQWVS